LEVLFGRDEIADRVRALAQEIADSWSGDILIVTVLKGAFVFAADLVRALNEAGVHPQITFITLSSYADSTRSSGSVRIIGAAPEVAGRQVLLLDDILDTGHTLQTARELLIERGALGVRTCVLLDKPSRREAPIAADLVGFTVEDKFVVGYGIDYAEEYRDLPYLGAIEAP
jgi:hypoxanthine phosphoribosyltransferase